MTALSSRPVTSLYVHVPFCAQKCEYCAFYSEAASGELINRYVAALVRELELIAPAAAPRTIFFGGGTPSLLTLRQWETILRTMERAKLLGAAEWTVECNPATVSLDKARLLRDFGVNRISMGVQSLDEKLLDRLGRVHSRAMVFKSFDTLRAAGFDNINVDLMFAIPGQTLAVWRATLAEALALGSEHLSSYEVIYEEDTPLFHQMQAGEFSVDEDLAAAMFEELLQRSADAGFRQYEVANFARETRAASSAAPANDAPSVSSAVPVAAPGTAAGSLPADAPAFACQHNVNYWRGGEFHGVGPSATGYVAGERTKNWANTQLYCEQLEAGRRAIESREKLPPLGRAGETAAFGLRMNHGWPFRQFQTVTGFDLRTEWRAEMDELTACGFAARSDERFQLTPLGLRYADYAAEKFLRP